MINIRIEQEERERNFLSPFTTLSVESKGRERPEEKDSLRTDFQRDRDRIIHCKAFRRLKHKTQVFIDPEEDHYRTRLTHTLEVSQIARTVARALRLNEDLTEAIALGHDLGHTPFGHAGERAIDAVYREYVPDAAFHHYEQSLRVVEFLENDGAGLNLTWEVRRGILSHSKGSDDLDLGEKSEKVSLEGQIVRVSDRIAYINHDLDDAVRAGVLQPDDIPQEIAGVLGKRHSERISTMVNDLVDNSRDKPHLKMSPNVVRAMDELKDFLFARVYSSDSSVPRMEELRKAGNMVKELFRYLMLHPEQLPDWLRPKGDDTNNTPLALEKREYDISDFGFRISDFPQSGSGVRVSGSSALRARAVCDFVAGMTDRYAQHRYAEYFLPETLVNDA